MTPPAGASLAIPRIGRDRVGTPSVPAQSTPAVTIDQCAGIVCVGPFIIPSQALTPAIGPIHAAATPPISSVLPTPPIDVAANTTGFTGRITPHAGELGTLGPVTLEVPTPFGALPVTVCAIPCPAAIPPNASLDGSATVSVAAGSTGISQTVPVNASV